MVGELGVLKAKHPICKVRNPNNGTVDRIALDLYIHAKWNGLCQGNTGTGRYRNLFKSEPCPPLDSYEGWTLRTGIR
jgi:hypothetical protein